MAETVQPVPSVVCASCQGRGCAVCHSIGETFFAGGRWVYWGKPISRASITERRVERWVSGTIAVLLTAFGFAGIALLYVVLRDAGFPLVAPWEAFSEARGNWRLILGSVTLLTDLYLFYRLSREGEHRAHIPPAPAKPALSLPDMTMEQALRLPAHDRFDLAQALTPRAYRALEQGWGLANRYHAAEYTAPFLFAVLLGFHSIIEVEVRLGLPLKKMRELLQQLLASCMSQAAVPTTLGHEFRSVLVEAYCRGVVRRTRHIDVTELFGGCLTVSQQLQAMFEEIEIPLKNLENVVAWITMQEDLRHQWRYFRSRARLKPKGAMDRAMTAVATPYLDHLSTDLTARARAGQLAPCVARDDAMDAIFRSLQEGHSVVLVGDSGVGKTAIINGIAQRMVIEDVPKILQDKRLIDLSIPLLVGSQSAQLGVEERLNRALLETARASNIVLVLENIHNLIGVSSGGAVTLDLSEILASALGSGRFLVLATTTTTDFRRFIEPSAGLSSAFTPLTIQEVDDDAAIRILEASSGPLEYHHQVFFSYGALAKLVELSRRYVHDQALPKKALTLMGEVAVSARQTRGDHAVISADDVARLVSQKVRIPLTEVTQEESAKLLNLEARIHERLVGQDEAVSAVAGALRRARVGLRDQKRPIVNLLFLGPTGVGKTQLAKTVAQVYFGSEDAMIRLDMSEYQEQASVAQLVGAPPGYSGGGTGGFLTDAVRRNPFSLVLLDELEKAHPEILNIFLQVMDDGRLSDSAGRTIDFSNVILIATSNAGTETISQGLQHGQGIDEIKGQLLQRDLSRYFHPEFLNRFDQVVVFTPLTKSEIVAITKLLLDEVAGQLMQRNIVLRASEAAIRELADKGFDPIFGARPLRRVIQDDVDNALARFLLTGKLGHRDTAILEPNGAIRVEEAPSFLQR